MGQARPPGAQVNSKPILQAIKLILQEGGGMPMVTQDLMAMEGFGERRPAVEERQSWVTWSTKPLRAAVPISFGAELT